MPLPTIHVGCTHFASGRLQALINSKGLESVALVDINTEASKEAIKKLEGNVPEGLEDRLYTSISKACKEHPAEVCLIYASTTSHAELIVESLSCGMHTLCVKPIACNQDEFRSIIEAHRMHSDLMLVQGQNIRWNPAAAKMRRWLKEPGGIGRLIAGEVRFWIRQNLWTGPDSKQPDAYVPGLFFHSGSSHQLDQLVAATGLPRYVTARYHLRQDTEIAQTGIEGTAGGNTLFEYDNGAIVTYCGTRAAHAGPYAWSGSWTMHGEEGDLIRNGGNLQLYRKGECVEDLTLQDLHPGLIEDDRLQFDAFAKAIKDGTDRDWLQHSTLDTWILMEACNESARTGERVDVYELRSKLMGEATNK